MEKATRSPEFLATEILVRIALDAEVPVGVPKPFIAIERLPRPEGGCNWRLPPLIRPAYGYPAALARAVAEAQALYDVTTPFLGASAIRP